MKRSIGVAITRINIIPPSELTDQHLIAEYREITMVPGSLKRTLSSKNGVVESKISKMYTLNKGHVYHFYNKGLYLAKRYIKLIEEMKHRGFNPDPNRTFPIEIFPKHLQKDWIYSREEMDIARERISKRISEKPYWYKYKGKPIHNP